MFTAPLLHTHTHTHGGQEQVRDQVKNFFVLPYNDRPAKNLYAKLEKLTLICRVTWAWSETI